MLDDFMARQGDLLESCVLQEVAVIAELPEITVSICLKG